MRKRLAFANPTLDVAVALAVYAHLAAHVSLATLAIGKLPLVAFHPAAVCGAFAAAAGPLGHVAVGVLNAGVALGADIAFTIALGATALLVHVAIGVHPFATLGCRPGAIFVHANPVMASAYQFTVGVGDLKGAAFADIAVFVFPLHLAYFNGVAVCGGKGLVLDGLVGFGERRAGTEAQGAKGQGQHPGLQRFVHKWFGVGQILPPPHTLLRRLTPLSPPFTAEFKEINKSLNDVRAIGSDAAKAVQQGIKTVDKEMEAATDLKKAAATPSADPKPVKAPETPPEGVESTAAAEPAPEPAPEPVKQTGAGGA